MAERAARVAPEVERATRELGLLALGESRRLMTAEIYSKPVDKRKDGKAKWTRTGALRRAERLQSRGFGKVSLVNDMVYARRRHEANKPGYPYHVAAGRTAHWRDDMRQRIEPKRQRIMAEMLRRILAGGL